MTPDRTHFEILVAEDNPSDIFLVREALEVHGVDFILQVVTDGAAAIALINALDAKQNGPHLDLLLLDMHLPKCSGEQVLKCLRSTENHAQLPVVVMTSSDSSALEANATKHAALNYFKKGSRLEEFLHLGLIVRRILMPASVALSISSESAHLIPEEL